VNASEFNRQYLHQVNELGNLVRGLELIIEYLQQNRSRGSRHALAADCRRILEKVPLFSLSSELLTSLRASGLIDEPPRSVPRAQMESARAPQTR